MFGGVLVAAGGAAAAWGVLAASGGGRPRDLAGAVVAPIGILVALAGVAALVVPGFLG
jgi:hypothetical protein